MAPQAHMCTTKFGYACNTLCSALIGGHLLYSHVNKVHAQSAENHQSFTTR